MLTKLAIAFLLLALTVLLHAAGLAFVMRRLPTFCDPRFLSRTWVLIRLAGWAIVIHMVEIAVWALFYWWKDCLPDFESALYFAAVTYTTVGYGDLTLSKDWRLLSAVEALTGILMCGWSTGFFFAFVSRLFENTAGKDK
jgi:hypothetical protein